MPELPVADPAAVVLIPVDKSMEVHYSFDADLAAIDVEAMAKDNE